MCSLSEAEKRKETMQQYQLEISELKKKSDELENKLWKDEGKMKDEEKPLIELQATA